MNLPSYSLRTPVSQKAVLAGLAVVATLLAAGFFSLTWRTGDSSRYYVLAQALAEGRGYTAVHFPGEPPEILTPPAHPYAVSLVMRLFGAEMRPAKLFSSVLYVLDVLLVYLAMTRLFPEHRWRAVSATLLGMCCIGVLTMSCWVMSEMHFFFISYLTLYLGLSRAEGVDAKTAFLFGLLASYAYQVRAVGLAVIAGVGGWLLLKRYWKAVPFYAVGVLLVASPWFIRNWLVVDAPDQYVDHISKMAGEAGGTAYPWERLPGDIATAFPKYFGHDVPLSLFFQLFDGRNLLAILHLGALAPLLKTVLLGLILLGFIRRCRSFSVAEVYTVFYWLIICSPPMPPQGNWYIYPVLPLVAYYLVVGVYTVGHAVGRLAPRVAWRPVAAGVTLLMTLYAVTTAGVAATIHFVKQQPLRGLPPWATERYLNFENEYMDAWARYVEACFWIGSNTPPDTVVAARKPQHTYLFVRRQGWRLDKPEQVGGTNAWHSLSLMAEQQPVYLIEDAFKGYEGATFSYGAHRDAVLRPIFAEHADRLELVHGTADPTTRVWRVLAR